MSRRNNVPKKTQRVLKVEDALGEIYQVIAILDASNDQIRKDLEMTKLELFAVSGFVERAAPGALHAIRAELYAVLALAQGFHRVYCNECTGGPPDGDLVEGEPFEGAKLFV